MASTSTTKTKRKYTKKRRSDSPPSSHQREAKLPKVLPVTTYSLDPTKTLKQLQQQEDEQMRERFEREEAKDDGFGEDWTDLARDSGDGEIINVLRDRAKRWRRRGGNFLQFFQWQRDELEIPMAAQNHPSDHDDGDSDVPSYARISKLLLRCWAELAQTVFDENPRTLRDAVKSSRPSEKSKRDSVLGAAPLGSEQERTESNPHPKSKLPSSPSVPTVRAISKAREIISDKRSHARFISIASPQKKAAEEIPAVVDAAEDYQQAYQVVGLSSFQARILRALQAQRQLRRAFLHRTYLDADADEDVDMDADNVAIWKPWLEGFHWINPVMDHLSTLSSEVADAVVPTRVVSASGNTSHSNRGRTKDGNPAPDRARESEYRIPVRQPWEPDIDDVTAFGEQGALMRRFAHATSMDTSDEGE